MSDFFPLVSIVIPVYNGSNYVREAIDSALSQTYENIEIIVVNDGSTDDGETERIALSYGDKIRYFKKENGGCASALNYGIAQMRGEWFSWLSHDDVYLPRKIESAVAMIEKYQLQKGDTVISCGTAVIDGNGKTVRTSTAGREEHISADAMFARFLCSGHALNGCALLIPKAVLDTVGSFSTTYTYLLDWIYWVDIAKNGFSFFEYDEPLVKNRRHSEQVSVKKQHLLEAERQTVLAELLQAVRTNTERVRCLWLCCFRNGFWGICREAERYCTISAKTRLLGFKQRLHLVIKGFAKKMYRLRYRIK